MRKACVLLCSLLILLQGRGQNVTGCWYGKAEVNSSLGLNNYLTEFYIRQKGNAVEGYFGYYFKRTYQSFRIKGSYSPQTREISFTGIPMLHHTTRDQDGIECPMNFRGVLNVSRARSSINGVFYSEGRYKYTCPELRAELRLDREEIFSDSTLDHFVAQKISWQYKDLNAVIVSEELPSRADTSKARQAAPATAAAANPVSTPDPLYEKLLERWTQYAREIEIGSDSLFISFYDNGNVDHDTITVFLNQKPVLISRELTLRALNLYVTLDSLREYNEITMYANNLGVYAPNTAVMVLIDGYNRHEVVLSSDLQKNAAVRLRRRIPKLKQEP